MKPIEPWTWTIADHGQAFREVAGGLVVDGRTGDPLFRVIGAHRYCRDWTVVVLPGQRALRFPVQGSRYHNALMTGVDRSGAEVLWFRLLAAFGDVEAVVSSDCPLNPEVLAVVCVAAPWLGAYYDSENVLGYVPENAMG